MLSRFLLAVFSLASAVIVLLRVPRREPSVVRIVVADLWALDRLTTVGAWLRSGAPPRLIELDLTRLFHLDASCLSSLESFCSRCAADGIRVSFIGCEPHVAESLLGRNLPAAVRRKADDDDGFTASRTLH